MSEITLAVMQADSVLGRELIDVLTNLETPWFSELRLFGETPGDFVRYRDQDLVIQGYGANGLEGVDIALLGDTSAVDAGAVAISVASASSEPLTPVVDPIVNRADVDEHRGILLVPDGPSLALARIIHALGGVKQVSATILQPASLLGPKALEELYTQSRALFNHEPLPETTLGGRLAFNVRPGHAIHGVQSMTDAPVHSTTFLVPVFGGTVVSTSIELLSAQTEETVLDRLKAMDGVEVTASVEPADVVGEAHICVRLESVSQTTATLIAAVDEVQCVAEALCEVAREVVLQEAF